MPMASHRDKPALIDSVISKRQRPHLQELGWFFCFNEAKVSSMFVCVCLQSDSDLSHAENSSGPLGEAHKSLSPLVTNAGVLPSPPPRFLQRKSSPTFSCRNLVSSSLKAILLPFSPNSAEDTFQERQVNTPLSVTLASVSVFVK
jgi:hypothetical protein